MKPKKYILKNKRTSNIEFIHFNTYKLRIKYQYYVANLFNSYISRIQEGIRHYDISHPEKTILSEINEIYI